MFKQVRSHIRGNAIAYVALFFALAGGAYAAATIAPANSVNSAAIINGQVKTPDIANGAVTESKVAPNSLTITLNGNLLGPTTTTLLANHGLTLTATCTPASNPASLTVKAASTSSARFEINYLRSSELTGPAPTLSDYVLNGTATKVLFDSFVNHTNDDDAVAGGSFVYTPTSGHGAVTGTFHYFFQNGGGECDFLGNAVPSS